MTAETDDDQAIDLQDRTVKALTKIVPSDNLSAYWAIYRALEAAEEESRTLPAVDINEDVKEIFEITHRLQTCGLLAKGTLEKVAEVLLEGSAHAIKSTGGAFVEVQERKHKKGFPRNLATDFLVYALVSDCFWFQAQAIILRHQDLKFGWEAVADFLMHQGIEGREKAAGWSGDMVRLRYARLNPAGVLETVRRSHALKPLDFHISKEPVGFLAAIAHELTLREDNSLATLALRRRKPVSIKKLISSIRKDVRSTKSNDPT